MLESLMHLILMTFLHVLAVTPMPTTIESDILVNISVKYIQITTYLKDTCSFVINKQPLMKKLIILL